MSAVFIVLALVSGFIYTNLHIPARYLQRRATGWDSYFYVAKRGAIIGLTSAVICIVIDYFDCIAHLMSRFGHHYQDIKSLSVTIHDLKMGAWGVTAILLSYIAGYTSKLFFFIKPNMKDKALAKAIACDHLDTFWIKATAEIRPILITLKSKKCYVGLPLSDASAIEDGGEYLSILPLLSGYRNKDDLSLHITANYYAHYKENDIDDTHDESNNVCLEHFQTITPKSEIESVSFFDIETFKAFKAKDNMAREFGSNGMGEPVVPSNEYTFTHNT